MKTGPAGEEIVERIETLTEEHLDECARVLISAFNDEPWNEHWTLETAKKELFWTLHAPGFLGFACVGDEISGFAAGYLEQSDKSRVFYLRSLCVRRDLHGKGVGSRLLKHLEQTLQEMDVNLIYLITHKGGQAEAFYERNGYRVSSEDIVMIHKW